LTQDDYFGVRQGVAFVFHCIYEKAPQKDEIIALLSKLAEDNSNNVKAMSNYSLARIYVHESSKAQSEQEFINDYNKAIEFFKKAYDYRQWDITEFCFTIHSVFNKILNGDIKNTDEIKRNISQLRDISAKSEERQYLLEIVESLGNRRISWQYS
jgi:tetratricopeptide (TPR) repeat protein